MSYVRSIKRKVKYSAQRVLKTKGTNLYFICILTTSAREIEPDDPDQGSQYLLGQGLYRPGLGYQRKAFQPATLFVKCVFRRAVTKLQMSHVADALTALGMFGGLGNRSRRGWGSLAIQTLWYDGIDPQLTTPTNISEFIQAAKRLAGSNQQNTELPPLTAFSANARCDIFPQETTNAMVALNQVGAMFQDYRSWETYKKDGAPSSHRFFPEDHDRPLKAVNGNCPEKLPKRVVFGMPHNYFFKSVYEDLKSHVSEKDASKSAKADIGIKADGRTRRASPLFIHIHAFPDQSVAVVQTLMKSVFVPDNTNGRGSID